MKILPALILSATTLGCASSMPVSPGDAGYSEAEIRVVEMKYLDDDGKSELFAVRNDGIVMANGKPICRVAGTQIETPDGKLMVSVAPDGTVTGPRAPPEARFRARERLVTKNATVSMTIPPTQQTNPMERGADAERFLDARMVLVWNNGNWVKFRGHFAAFDRRATRLALLLATLLLMRPGTLDNPPQTASAPL